MKIRNLKTRKKYQEEQTHEDRAISEMFEDSGIFELELTTDDPAQQVEPFDTIDFKLVTEDTAKLWEENAVKYAKQVRDAVVASLSFLEAVRGVEEHLVKDMNMSISLLDQKFTDEISKFLSMRIQAIHLDHLEFPDAEKRRIFNEIILNTGKASARLLQMLQDLDKQPESNPYGMVRKQREHRGHEG